MGGPGAVALVGSLGGGRAVRLGTAAWRSAGEESYVELRYAKPFLDRLQQARKELSDAAKRAKRPFQVPAIPKERWHLLDDGAYVILDRSAPRQRKVTRAGLVDRRASVLGVLLQAKARHDVLARSGLHAVVSQIGKSCQRYQNAKDQSNIQKASSLDRLLRTQAMARLWGMLYESARGIIRDAEAAFAGRESTLRRLSRLGVPASSIPDLLKLGGLPRMTVAQVKNLLIRKRVLPPSR